MSTTARKALLISLAAFATLIGLFIFSFAHFPKHKADLEFGDQNLKSTVALVELHKVRHGKYPESLNQLEFLGPWDRGYVNAVRYVSDPEGKTYYLEVTRGWIGRPELSYPPEFWRGTGYNPALKPRDW